MFVIGGLLVAVVLFLDGGLMGLIDRLAALFSRKKKPEQAQMTPQESK